MNVLIIIFLIRVLITKAQSLKSNSEPKNVCKNFHDYLFPISMNPNCWHEPNVYLSLEEIITRYGYKYQVYNITTEDGYILKVLRVNNRFIDPKELGPPVLLQHGAGGDASMWFNADIESLVFILANNNYDVWVPHSRGTTYSSGHVKYKIKDREYWNFSFHELGIYDVPAVIDFMASTTGQKGQIRYIGQSMGATLSLVYASLKSDHAMANVKMMISMAPMAYMKYGGSLALKGVAMLISALDKLLARFGIYGIGVNTLPILDFLRRICIEPPLIVLCSVLHFYIVGVTKSKDRYETYPVAFIKFFSGTSVKTIKHYTQINQRFQLYDYGIETNLKIYNSSIPPEYPLVNIKIPYHIFYGNMDTLADPRDVVKLYEALKTEKTITRIDDYCQYNFEAAKDSREFYKMVLEYLRS